MRMKKISNSRSTVISRCRRRKPTLKNKRLTKRTKLMRKVSLSSLWRTRTTTVAITTWEQEPKMPRPSASRNKALWVFLLTVARPKYRCFRTASAKETSRMASEENPPILPKITQMGTIRPEMLRKIHLCHSTIKVPLFWTVERKLLLYATITSICQTIIVKLAVTTMVMKIKNRAT